MVEALIDFLRIIKQERWEAKSPPLVAQIEEKKDLSRLLGARHPLVCIINTLAIYKRDKNHPLGSNPSSFFFIFLQ